MTCTACKTRPTGGCRWSAAFANEAKRSCREGRKTGLPHWLAKPRSTVAELTKQLRRLNAEKATPTPPWRWVGEAS